MLPRQSLLLFALVSLPVNAAVPVYSYEIVKTYPHDPKAFTEGLFYLNGFLYESTGLERQSSIRKVKLETGEVLQKINVPPEYFGEGIVKIDNEMVAASEAGYVGERAISTWREHMRTLKALGFVDYREGPAGPMQFVLLLNPYHVAKNLRGKGWVDERDYTSLLHRAMEIGAAPDLAD